MTSPPTRHRKHLMVPGQPPPSPRSAMSITTVQRWVLSSLAFLTIYHFAAGIVLAAVVTDPGETGSRIGLLVVASVCGTLAVVAALLIHQRRILTPWLLLGPLPSLVGVWVCFGR